jgi:hypothetical protein
MITSWWMKVIRFLFLIKEIVSKEGEVHFRRYRLPSPIPHVKFYIHHILISDYDDYFHDHPWHFRSRLLKGSYREQASYHPDHAYIYSREYHKGDVIKHHAQDAHKITLTSPDVWTFVVVWGIPRYWGYQTEAGWIGHQEYRQLKNEGKFRQ